MSRSSLLKTLVSAAFAGAHVFSMAGGPGAAAGGGATELTQFMNNMELVKVSMDSAQTASTTVSQYMTQMEQYRNQLINTVGINPAVLGPQLQNIDRAYQQISNYRNSLFRVQGSLSQQQDAWNQRYTSARLANKTVAQQIQEDRQLYEQRNQAAMRRLEREQQILDETQRDIQQLSEDEKNIPASLGQNKSIQNMHRSLNKVAFQNSKIIELLVESNALKREQMRDPNDKAANSATILENQIRVQEQLRQRQSGFSNWQKN